ncbi:GNAT family N-acetyltransferase [Natronosporangium hydrolyticum]|uniref:GNAT family N-acetyltransferase n=1 Tax=Natronosporangium hydrolyticum TaxID=2811111 RepID=A0A895Y6Y1_9ACTN|nr:GNAT family protein [Natronosporangium hydrolyticum]QSB13497.1 GNAT family N-acetyltransferase [Natronosporangium hydrolyticum]
MQQITFRPLRADEFPLRFHDYRNPPTSGVGRRSRTFDEEVAAGGYRPEWCWVALRGDELVARVAFWAPPDAPLPWSVDLFDPGNGPDRVEVGAALLRAAYQQLVPADYRTPPQPDGGRPDYHLFLPADWRDHPAAYAEATDRIAAAEQAGLTHFVERLNLRWEPTDGLPPRSTRLRFVPIPDDGPLVDALARVSDGALDAYARQDLARLGDPVVAAEYTIADLAEMPGGRGWWRLAYDTEGALVGLVLPTRNPSSATIGYLGVVPEQRGRGYSDDLVAEALHIFAAAGEPVVNDATDVGNAPMAAAFDRVGYRVVGRRIIMI